jgi:hypothetical protein
VNVTTDFTALFLGRTDAYGAWEGGCIRQPVTPDLYTQHLQGVQGIGIYCGLPNNTCWWGCVDIDTDDQPIALNIQTALRMQNIPAWTERTRRGHHVWVFAAAPVTLKEMRRCLQMACKVVNYDPKEVNPKQEHLADGEVGNYVRLPYMGGDACYERYMYEVSSGNSRRLTVAEFTEQATANLAPVFDIRRVAGMWVPNVTVAVTVNATLTPHVEALTKRLDGLGWTIWRDGPLPGTDRSTAMAHLAHICRTQGLTPTDAFHILKSATWQKFVGRTDEDQRITELVERIYQ